MALYDPNVGPTEPDPVEYFECVTCEGEFEARDMANPHECLVCREDWTEAQMAKCEAGRCDHVDADGGRIHAVERVG